MRLKYRVAFLTFSSLTVIPVSLQVYVILSDGGLILGLVSTIAWLALWLAYVVLDCWYYRTLGQLTRNCETPSKPTKTPLESQLDILEGKLLRDEIDTITYLLAVDDVFAGRANEHAALMPRVGVRDYPAGRAFAGVENVHSVLRPLYGSEAWHMPPVMSGNE